MRFFRSTKPARMVQFSTAETQFLDPYSQGISFKREMLEEVLTKAKKYPSALVVNAAFVSDSVMID